MDKYTLYVLLRKKVHSKYTSFVLPEKEYIWSIFGKCSSFILQILKNTLSILFQTSVLVKNSFSKKCSLSILWNRKKHSEDLEGLSESWNHFEKSVLKVWFKYKGRYTLGDRLQQQFTVTDHSVCTGPAASCSNMLRRHIAATNRSDKSLRVYCRNFVKIFVSATEFCRCDKPHKFCLIWFFATCCCDKILLQRQRFSQKFSSTHEAICRCDVSQWHVAATCRLVCTNLNLTSKHHSIQFSVVLSKT